MSSPSTPASSHQGDEKINLTPTSSHNDGDNPPAYDEEMPVDMAEDTEGNRPAMTEDKETSPSIKACCANSGKKDADPKIPILKQFLSAAATFFSGIAQDWKEAQASQPQCAENAPVDVRGDPLVRKTSKISIGVPGTTIFPSSTAEWTEADFPFRWSVACTAAATGYRYRPLEEWPSMARIDVLTVDEPCILPVGTDSLRTLDNLDMDGSYERIQPVWHPWSYTPTALATVTFREKVCQDCQIATWSKFCPECESSNLSYRACWLLRVWHPDPNYLRRTGIKLALKQHDDIN